MTTRTAQTNALGPLHTCFAAVAVFSVLFLCMCMQHTPASAVAQKGNVLLTLCWFLTCPGIDRMQHRQ